MSWYFTAFNNLKLYLNRYNSGYYGQAGNMATTFIFFMDDC